MHFAMTTPPPSPADHVFRSPIQLYAIASNNHVQNPGRSSESFSPEEQHIDSPSDHRCPSAIFPGDKKGAPAPTLPSLMAILSGQSELSHRCRIKKRHTVGARRREDGQCSRGEFNGCVKTQKSPQQTTAGHRDAGNPELPRNPRHTGSLTSRTSRYIRRCLRSPRW